MNMREFLLSAAIALGAVQAGCSVPDEDDVETLEQGISLNVITPEMRIWAANRYTAGYIRGQSGSYDGATLGWAECPGYGRMTVDVGSMLHCLNTDQSLLYDHCLEKLLTGVKSALAPESAEANCHWDSFYLGYAPDELPDECDPDNTGTARAILDGVFDQLPEPPPLHIQAMFAAGAFFGPMGLFCPLDTRGCPGVPWKQPGASPGGSTGGDR